MQRPCYLPAVDGGGSGWAGSERVHCLFGGNLGKGVEHLDNLSSVLTRLREAGLRLKSAKCHLVQKQVEFLGHVVSAMGVAADPAKVEAVKNYPTPTDLKKLRSFLGLASDYRRFIPHFSAVAGPLHALTRKDVPFEWTAACQSAV